MSYPKMLIYSRHCRAHQKHQRGHRSVVFHFQKVVFTNLTVKKLSFATKLMIKCDIVPAIYLRRCEYGQPCQISISFHVFSLKTLWQSGVNPWERQHSSFLLLNFTQETAAFATKLKTEANPDTARRRGHVH